MPAQQLPYPPSPTDVPEGLTDYSSSYVRQQNKLLAGLFAFLIFYLFFVVLFAMVGVWCVITVKQLFPLKVAGAVVCGTFFVFLVKGFFKRHRLDKEQNIEITDEEHPLLFKFIDTLCNEIGAPLPTKVFVSPDVNAACVRRLSLINLFVEPKQELLIGLGLVNCMNLSEFKAVLAHEFGHFCQSGQVNSYTMVVQGIIWDMVKGEDWFDRTINWFRQKPKHRMQPNDIRNLFRFFAAVIGWILDQEKKVLSWLLYLFALQSKALSREREFHADRVAVSVAGSDNSTHMLLRVGFGMKCLMQAINDLVPPARDHKMYSNNLYLHQSHAAAVVRRVKKDAELGLPPFLNGLTAGEHIRVFDAEQEELEDNDDTPPMWRSHPPDADREDNVKRRFIPAVVDHRSAWILFNNPAELKERMTYKFYRMSFSMPKNTELTDAVKVQEYIDNEHLDTTYDAKYHGAYDERVIEPGDLNELNTIIHDSPWPEERMLKVYDKLYEGCRDHAEEFSDGYKELNSLKANVIGKPSAKMKKRIKEMEDKLERTREWFQGFDRRVYLLHMQMADEIDKQMKDELLERYRFQLEVQKFYQEARHHLDEANAHLSAHRAMAEGELRMRPAFQAEVIAVLRAAWKALKKIVQNARDISLPAMKNFEEGERLADFILDGKLVPEPPLSDLKGVWVQKLMDQLSRVKNRCLRLHFKSLGGVLSIQEKIATTWLAKHRLTQAEVIAAEVIPAEVIPAEIIAAEIIAAEVIPADFIAAEELPVDSLPVDVVAAEVVDIIPAEVVSLDEVTDPSPLDEPPPVQAVLKAEPAPVPSFSTTLSEAAMSDNPFAFELDHTKAPTKPEPVNESVIASLDADAAPTATAPPAPANPPAATPPVLEVFSLDADEAPAPPVASTAPAALAAPVPAPEVFSLDEAEEIIPAAPAQPVAGGPVNDGWSSQELDEEVITQAEVVESDVILAAEVVSEESESDVILAAEVVSEESESDVSSPVAMAALTKTTRSSPPKFGSGFVAQPATNISREAMPSSGVTTRPEAPTHAGSGGQPATESLPEMPAVKADPAKPANRRQRPPVKITVVKPGGRSPFAK